jgi:uncharacterized protein (TIGR02145 family)
MKNLLLCVFFTAISLNDGAQTVVDMSGNVYNTISIGTQVWMAENLRTTRFSNGDSILNITDISSWDTLKTPASCTYNNTLNADVIKAYGRLYNWYTVNTDMICPTNWHVPSDTEWTSLITFLGGDTAAGGKLKEAGTVHWNSPNTGATNESGFTALPGGECFGGLFELMGQYGQWWCSNEASWDTNSAYVPTLHYTESLINLGGAIKTHGYSIRCVSNIPAAIDILNKEVIEIYPNPANKRLFIKNTKFSNSLVSIFNLQGKLISEMHLTSNSIDISKLENGVYILRILESGNIFFAKFIKE